MLDQADQPHKRIAMSDIAVVIVSHPQVTYTQAVLSLLAEAGAVFISCGPSRMPNGMLVPLAAHGTQTERFAAQSQAPKPLCKRLWKQVTRCKIESQATALQYIRGDDGGLRKLKSKVRSGDPTNVEAQAARRYWRKLFAEGTFRRDVDAADENQFLNYGYAVLRAIVARSICAAGLHPTIGLHHHNRYNAFCLADDLMEPLRPIVDVAAYHLTRNAKNTAELSPEQKQQLVHAITSKQEFSGEQRGVFDVASRMASSLAQVFVGEQIDLDLPTLTFGSGK